MSRALRDYQADLDRFVEEVVMKAGPLPRIVMAHSFGALVTLHYLRRKPGVFTKAILLVRCFRYRCQSTYHSQSSNQCWS